MPQIKRLIPKYKIFSAIMTGFLLYGLIAFSTNFFILLPRVLAIVAFLFIFGSAFVYRARKINPLQGHIRTVYYLYLVWILFIIIRPLFLEQPYSLDTLNPYSEYGLLSYLLPLIILL
jgi:hypothetical protein